MLPRAHRLTHSRAFQALYRRGRRWEHELMTLHLLPRPAGDVRFGVVAGKKVGGAVRRNRVRRLLREAIRRHLPELRRGAHGVWVARAAAAATDYATVERAVVELMDRARLFRAEAPVAAAAGTGVNTGSPDLGTEPD